MAKKKNITPDLDITFTEDVFNKIDKRSTGTRKQTEALGPNRKKHAGKDRIIATNSSVPFPGVPLPFTVESNDQLKEFERSLEVDSLLAIVPVRDPEKPASENNLCNFGVMGKVMKIVDLLDGSKNAFIICEERVMVYPEMQISVNCFNGVIQSAPEFLEPSDEELFISLMGMVQETYDYVKNYFQEIANVQMAPPKELRDNIRVYINFIIVTSPLPYLTKQNLLVISNLCERARELYEELEKIRHQIDIRKEIHSKASFEMDKEMRNQFLRTQIRTMQNEIGEGEEDDIQKLIDQASQKNWPEEMNTVFNKEIAKLRRFNPTTPDYALAYNYIETLLNLPWNNISTEEIDIKALKNDLDKDHYGMEKIKERIIEHVAVLKLKGDMRSPILCLYGPPGVGKTSLCKSIADSLKRDYARISLGGLHDETQIRGHRRTYVGALPGRIIAALEKSETNNPVFVLDEIDKIGNDHRGDPSQALLEVLDPEQNHKFHDNYLDVDYDLSKIFFIATANNLSTISAPLLDRMELINISGYLQEEKIEIAKRHLIPKLLENHGFRKGEIKFTDEAIETVIDNYTRESGVRKLEKTMAKVLRKIAVLKARDEKYPKTVNKKTAVQLLGKEDIMPQSYETDLPPGVVAGLAWTPAGGEILFFESSLSKGKGNITLTGNLGDIMKESATIAMQWVKANAENLNIDPDRFTKTDVHLHVPEGAVPKDGPSAGITMICSIVSSFTGRKMTDRTAMTGEATLRGKVLPVGGIKEKILGAKRAGINRIILSSKNRRDVEEIESKYVEGLEFVYVNTVDQVVREALIE